MKKILVMGESNSVRIGGWVAGLAEGLTDDFAIDNRSIGSTGLLNTIYQIASKRIDISIYDVVLIDTLINDTLFFADSCADFARYFTDILSYIRSFGLPVIVMNFERRNVPANHPNSLKPIAQKICKEQKVFFFDTRSRLDKRAKTEGVGLERLYSDTSHPHLHVARALGLEVADIIRNLPEKDETTVPKAFDFAIIDHHCQVTAKRLWYKNNLVDMPGFLIDSTRTNIRIPPHLRGAVLIGLLYNVASTTGCLRVEADASLVKRLTDSRHSTGKLIIWGRRFHKKIRLTSRLVLQAVKSHDEIEDTEFCLTDSIVGPARPLCNVAALLLHLPSAAVHAPTPFWRTITKGLGLVNSARGNR